MKQDSRTTDADGTGLFAGDVWFDPMEAGIRDRVRGFILKLQELAAAPGRSQYERAAGKPKGYRNGMRERQLVDRRGSLVHPRNPTPISAWPSGLVIANPYLAR